MIVELCLVVLSALKLKSTYDGLGCKRPEVQRMYGFGCKHVLRVLQSHQHHWLLWSDRAPYSDCFGKKCHVDSGLDYWCCYIKINVISIKRQGAGNIIVISVCKILMVIHQCNQLIWKCPGCFENSWDAFDQLFRVILGKEHRNKIIGCFPFQDKHDLFNQTVQKLSLFLKTTVINPHRHCFVFFFNKNMRE